MNFFPSSQVMMASPSSSQLGGYSRILNFQGQQSPQMQILQQPSQTATGKGLNSPLTSSNLHILQDPQAVFFRSPSSLSNQVISNQQQFTSYPQSASQYQQCGFENLGIVQKQSSIPSNMQSSRLTLQSMPATYPQGMDGEMKYQNKQQLLSPKSLISRAQSPQQQLEQREQYSQQYPIMSVLSPLSRGQSPSSSRKGFYPLQMNSASSGQSTHLGYQNGPDLSFTQQQSQGNQSFNSQLQKFQLPSNIQMLSTKMAESIARSEKLKRQVASNELFSRESEQIKKDLTDAPSNLPSAIKQRIDPSLFFEDISPLKNFASQSIISTNSQQPFHLKSLPISDKPSGIAQIVNEYGPSGNQLGGSLRAFSTTSFQIKPQSNINPSSQGGISNITKQVSEYQYNSFQKLKEGSIKSFSKGSKTENQDEDLDGNFHWLNDYKKQIEKIRKEFKAQQKMRDQLQTKLQIDSSNKVEIQQQQLISKQIQPPFIAKNDDEKDRKLENKLFPHESAEKQKLPLKKQKVQNQSYTEIKRQLNGSLHDNNPTNVKTPQQKEGKQNNINQENKKLKFSSSNVSQNSLKKFTSRVSEHREKLEQNWNNLNSNVQFGIKQMPNGLLFTGSLINQIPHGYGVLKDANNNDIYKGDWIEGKYDGSGILFHQASIFKSKEIKININDLSNIIKEGLWQKYEGELKDNQIQGFGTLIFQNGDKVVGSFNKGIPQGQCSFYKQNESVYAIVYEQGKLVEVL